MRTANRTYIDIDGEKGYAINNSNNKIIAELNPIRYRGYYYDAETELYYLNSRYYDPETGRFLNADDVSYLDPDSLGGLNLYAYCLNNPVMLTDSTGCAPWWQWLLFGIGVALVVAAAVVLTVATGGAAAGMLGAVAVGAAKGALIGAAIGSVAGIAGGAIYAGVTGADMGQSILSGFLIGFGGGAIIGAVAGGVAGGISFSNAANAWSGGKNAMISHFKSHGTQVGAKNPVQYTKNALKITKNGKFLAEKNAYVKFSRLTSKGKELFDFVGLNRANGKITTYFIKVLLGLI